MTRRDSGGASPAQRIRVALACSVCTARNYKTTRAARETEPLQLKKFCKACNGHTLHIESK